MTCYLVNSKQSHGNWNPPSNWTEPSAVLYQSFDSSDGFVLMEGTQAKSDSVQLVLGKVGYNFFRKIICVKSKNCKINHSTYWLTRHKYSIQQNTSFKPLNYILVAVWTASALTKLVWPFWPSKTCKNLSQTYSQYFLLFLMNILCWHEVTRTVLVIRWTMHGLCSKQRVNGLILEFTLKPVWPDQRHVTT